MAKLLQRRQRATASRAFLFNVYPPRETLGVKEVVTWCHHTLARSANLDVIHANDAIGARRDVTHFDVALACSVIAFNKSTLRQHVFGNSPVIVVHFGEYSQIPNAIAWIDVMLTHQYDDLRCRPRDEQKAVREIWSEMHKV